MTDEELTDEALQALLDDATPGPWWLSSRLDRNDNRDRGIE